MWSIGNEVGEADGSDKSVATVRRLVKTIKDVDATRYVTMGADKFRFGDGLGGHEKVAAELDAVGFNYSEANYESTVSYTHLIPSSFCTWWPTS